MIQMPKLLVCCEESQRVCMAFRERGWEAYSCDIEPCSGDHPEWHIQQDVLPLINGDCEFDTVDGEHHVIEGEWDLLICHPPCTYLSNAGARHLWKGHVLNQERYEKGLEAKEFFMKFINAKCNHIIVENPMLQPVEPVKPIATWCPSGSYSHKHGEKHRGMFTTDRAKNRAKTFEGVARAMVEQWGGFVEKRIRK